MLRFCVFLACALCGGFVPHRLHPRLARVIEWATTTPERA
jgi:hypothetical protein